ncbi:MAG: hypothetical protein ISS88_00130 [Candidatus Portnoybacteria bacterium]|nr:hypothetical protein [Candidatus Portnoybacteria bacterium]
MSKRQDRTGKIIVKFNKNLYNLRAIKLAIKEYQNLANFSLRQKRKYFQVELRNIDKEVKQIIRDEFCNYVLFKSKEN